MTGVVEQEEERQRKEAIIECLRELISQEVIKNEAAIGITKFVIDQGTENLSPKQKYVFETEVVDEFLNPTCPNCGGHIPWDQVIHHIPEPGFCDSCQHSYDRMVENNP